MENITTVGIDLAKLNFQIMGLNHKGKSILSKKVYRDGFLAEILKMPKNVVLGMEACSSAHYWGRVFQSHNYKVKIMPANRVKPYGTSQKNDKQDSLAIAEAATRENIKEVPVKSVEQLDLQALHRVRERHNRDRTSLMNEMRSFLEENGIVFPQGRDALGKSVASALESDQISSFMKITIRDLYDELLELEKRLEKATSRIEQFAKTNDCCKRLETIPGIGKLTATALYAAFSHMKLKNGRSLAALLGLIPKQHSSGGKTVLGHITKHGDQYIRKLLVHGARSIILNANKYDDKYRSWVKTIRDKKGWQKGSVAVANKNARLAWAIMFSDAVFNPNFKPKKA